MAAVAVAVVGTAITCLLVMSIFAKSRYNDND